MITSSYDDIIPDMRTIVDIPADQIDRLDALAKSQRRSRAAVLRDVIEQHFAHSKRSQYLQTLEAIRGSWKEEFTEDAVNYQERLRAEWSRE